MEKFGQYILLEKVGSGGMAELFKAKKLGIEGFERVLAIKRILPHLSSDEEFIDMFVAEAKLVARLSNKNIAQVFDFGKISENYFIAMEYIRGKDLRGILKRCRENNIKLPVALSVFIAKEVASALSYAHKLKDSMGKSLNIIHRDVSPQNVLISYEGDVKVVDFGIAKAGAHSKTTTGVLKGKLSYMSPEQAWGKPIDLRSDIFSLGVVLYEMLTGERLFKGDTEINTLEKVREAKIEPLPSTINADLPPALEAKLLKALAREVIERYQNASDLATDLGEILFELLHVDPALSMKQVMHDLFKAEIEAEHMAEIEEETVRVQLEQEPVAAGAGGYKLETARAGVVTRAPERKKFGMPKTKKKRIFPYVISTTLIFIIAAAAFMFWQNKTSVQSLKDWFRKLSFPDLKSLSSKPQVPEEPLNIAVTMKDGKVLYWGSYFEEDFNYCTQKPDGKFCIPKGDIVKIGSLRKETVGPAHSVQQDEPKKVAEEQKPGSLGAPEDAQKTAKQQAGKQLKKTEGEEITGELTINAMPWADVYVNGRPYGTTPKTIEDLKPGTYKVRLENPNFPAWETKVNISQSGAATVSHKFGGFGKVVVNAVPWANVYLDGTMKGQTPLTIDKISAGKHQIKVGRDGYAEFSKTLEIKEETTEQLSVNLKKEGGQ